MPLLHYTDVLNDILIQYNKNIEAQQQQQQQQSILSNEMSKSNSNSDRDGISTRRGLSEDDL